LGCPPLENRRPPALGRRPARRRMPSPPDASRRQAWRRGTTRCRKRRRDSCCYSWIRS